jgi:hypothetical protein
MVRPSIGGKPTRRSFHAGGGACIQGSSTQLRALIGASARTRPNILKLGEVRGSAIQRAEQLVDFHS